MSRASNLSEDQWQDVERRAGAGEPKRALAKEFGLAVSSLREMLARRALRPAPAVIVAATHDPVPASAEPPPGPVERHLAPLARLVDSVVGLLELVDAARGRRDFQSPRSPAPPA